MREENRDNLIQEALNLLDDELISEADEKRKKTVNITIERSSIIKNKRVLRYTTTIAASVAVFLLAGTIWSGVIVPNQADEGIVEEQAIEENYNYPEGYQSTDSVTSESYKEREELNETPDISEAEKSQSVELKDGEVIHLPCQELGAVAGVESIARVNIPAMKVELAQPENGVVMDMLAFFIYEGRCYVQDQYYKVGFSLVGDYVGTSKGLIDEWTTEEGYVDYVGSVSGQFYEVKGYDPAFMLCMKFDDGAVETFINNNGISLGKGADLIEDRLCLTNNYEKMTFKTQKEWDEDFRNEKNHVLPEAYDNLIEQFLDDFSSADFIYVSDTPLDVNGTGRYHDNKDNYHLTFHTKDGLEFDFVLYEEGYVRFQGFGGVCVQIDSNLYEQLLAAFEAEL